MQICDNEKWFSAVIHLHWLYQCEIFLTGKHRHKMFVLYTLDMKWFDMKCSIHVFFFLWNILTILHFVSWKTGCFFIIMTLFKSCFSLLKPSSVIKLIFLLGKKSMDSKEEEKPGVNANDQLCMCTRFSGSYIKVVVFTLLIKFFMWLCRSIHGGRRSEVWSIGPHLYRILKRNIPGFNWQATKVSLYLYFYSPGASCRKQLPVRLSGIFFFCNCAPSLWKSALMMSMFVVREHRKVKRCLP